MSENAVNNILGETMDKLRTMVEANAIIGNPITTPDGTWIVPVSKLTFGFGCGGSDYQKNGENPDKQPVMFGGGTGAGVHVIPAAFLVASGGEVRVLPVSTPANTAADRIIDMIPGIVDKISASVKEKKEKKENDGIFE